MSLSFIPVEMKAMHVCWAPTWFLLSVAAILQGTACGQSADRSTADRGVSSHSLPRGTPNRPPLHPALIILTFR